MAIDEMLARLRRDLEETYGVEGAAFLMDRPSGGWDELATKGDLERLELRIRTELHQEIREQTRWVATVVIGAMSVSIAATAIVGAALRFA